MSINPGLLLYFVYSQQGFSFDLCGKKASKEASSIPHELNNCPTTITLLCVYRLVAAGFQ